MNGTRAITRRGRDYIGSRHTCDYRCIFFRYVRETHPRSIAVRERVMSTWHESFIGTHIRREHPVSCYDMRNCLITGLSPVPRWTGLNLARNHWPLVSSRSCPFIARQHALPVSTTALPCPHSRKARSLHSTRHPDSPDLGTRCWVPR